MKKSLNSLQSVTIHCVHPLYHCISHDPVRVRETTCSPWITLMRTNSLLLSSADVIIIGFSFWCSFSLAILLRSFRRERFG